MKWQAKNRAAALFFTQAIRGQVGTSREDVGVSENGYLLPPSGFGNPRESHRREDLDEITLSGTACCHRPQPNRADAMQVQKDESKLPALRADVNPVNTLRSEKESGSRLHAARS
jgi:hypothetical protein